MEQIKSPKSVAYARIPHPIQVSASLNLANSQWLNSIKKERGIPRETFINKYWNRFPRRPPHILEAWSIRMIDRSSTPKMTRVCTLGGSPMQNT